MSHEIRASLRDLQALAGALKDLQWYTTGGGYEIAGVSLDGQQAVWSLAPRSEPPTPAPAAPRRAGATAHPMVGGDRRRVVEPGDEVLVETKVQQMDRRFGDGNAGGAEGVVFRVLTRGPHPHGMKVELRDRTVGRVKKNLTMPGAGEATGR